MPRGRKPSNTTASTKKQQDEEDIKNEWLSFAKDSMYGVSLKNKKSSSNMKMLTKTQINSMLLNPQLSYESLQNLSQLFMTKSGIYKRLIEYFSYMMTFDTMLIPIIETSNIKNKQKITKNFETTALYLEKINPKSILPVVAKELFTNGEVFAYKIEDKKSIEYKIISNKYCLPYCKTEGVMRYVIDMQKFSNSEDVLSYPMEIQNACKLYKTGNKDIFIDGQYYAVSDNGVCFTFNNNGGHGIPPFSGIFNDLINLDENKQLQSTVDRLENTKMIHNKIPLNKDSKPIVDPTLAKKYNEAIKNNISEGVFSIVNPFEAEVLNLNSNSQRTTTLVENAVSQIFDDSGVSDLLFNNKKASGEALKKSIVVDACIVFSTLLPMFTDYLSWECSNLSKNNWKCVVMPFINDDIKNIQQQCLNDMAYGGSRFRYLASCGYSPLQGMNLLQMEQVMGISDLFIPAQSSYTQSDKGGKPTNEELGIPVSDITDNQNETQ